MADVGVLTAREAASFLRISMDSLYAAANRGDLPVRRIGRRMLFSRRALVAWLEGASPRSADTEKLYVGTSRR
jgi:excisionase family DNA binding protein